MMKHALFNLAVKFGLSSEDSLELFNNGVRDRNDVNVYKCKMSGMIILDNITTGSKDTYIKKSGMEYFVSHADQTKERSFITQDDEERTSTYKEMIRGKSWLDFGCGQGGALLSLKDVAQSAEGAELQPGPREYLNSKGVKCHASLDSIPDETYDIITMFHVFEHLDDPIGVLEGCYKKLKKGGKLIVEVPHAEDALLSLYKSDPFKQFTLWSEHLILHTKHSLKTFINGSSFEVETVKSYQRYPLSNHLHWLANDKPGGHEAWSFLNSPELMNAYEVALSLIDKTDTIVAYCRK